MSTERREPSRRDFLRLGAGTAAGVAGWSLLGSSEAAARPVNRGLLVSTIRRMSLEEKVGQMFMLYAYGESVEETVQDNESTYGVGTIEKVIEKYRPGGIIYFTWAGNLQSPEQTAGLSNGIQRVAAAEGAGIPMLISTDQEQGVVVRVDEPATQFPGNMALGATRNKGYAEKAAAITGEELRAMGINTNNAPDADVNSNPRNPVIGVRSFGSRPELVSRMTRAQIGGYQGANVAATAKHFPGHGDTDVDSHYGLPKINKSLDELRREDLPPFEAAIEAGVDAIMTAHIVVPALEDSGLPATLSKSILTGLLREEMGFDGLVITDALTMEAVQAELGNAEIAVRAVQAGVDMMLMPPEMDVAYGAVREAVRAGEISERRIDDSVYRILELKAERGLFEHYHRGRGPGRRSSDYPHVEVSAVAGTVGAPEHRAAADAITEETITLVKNEADTLPLAADSGKNVLVTGAGGAAASPADSVDRSTLGSLADALEERGVSAREYETGTSPDAAAREEALARARGSDLVVVTTNNAWSGEAQQELVKALLGAGKPVIVAAVRDPYDIAYFPNAETYLATYSYRSVSMRALVEVMFDEVAPSGELPVSIPEAGQTGTTLYPYGHGLGYAG